MNLKNKIILGVIVVLFFVGGTIYFTLNVVRHDVAKSYGPYALMSDAQGKTFLVNKENEYSFSITDGKGSILKDFAITHTKPMHVIVVRKDLAYFQHIHPEFNQKTGVFSFKDLTFPTDGQYRIFADFSVLNSSKDVMGMSSETTLYEDVAVGDNKKYLPKPLSLDARTKKFDGIDVSLYTHGIPKSGIENMLMFGLYDSGKPVTNLQPYLGALGHAVILREGTLDFIHAHPVENVDSNQGGMINFMVTFPEPGIYKAFTQFQRNGKVTTTDFTIVVEQGLGNGGNTETQHMSH